MPEKLRGQILIVDDKPANLKVLENLLVKNGFMVRPAINGEIALQSVRSSLPDLILLDIKMPDIDGYEVCRRLKADQKTERIPVVFISALDDPLDKVKAFDSGGVDYVTKPFQIQEVLARVNTHLSLRNMQRTVEEQNHRLQTEIRERKKAEAALNHVNQNLEDLVREQTEDLLQEMEVRKQAESRLRKQEQQLRQTQKLEAVGTLAGGIAHDFNNIILAIRGNAEIAKNHELVEDHSALYSIEQILQGCHRASKLVTQLLTFARMKEGEKIRINLKPIIKEVVNLIKAALPANIELRQDLKSEIDEIVADPGSIHQMMMNLCNNGIQAIGGSGGNLELKLEDYEISGKKAVEENILAAGSYLKITVTDTGSGIPAEIKERIFEPYFTTKPVNQGTGLGLAVTYSIVKELNGRIKVTSKLGQGSSFSVILPKANGDSAIESNAVQRNSHGNKGL